MDGPRVLSSEASLGGVLEACRLHPENLAQPRVQAPAIGDFVRPHFTRQGSWGQTCCLMWLIEMSSSNFQQLSG